MKTKNDVRVLNLKVSLDYFDQVVDGTKPFEVRLDDRKYQTGDLLVLWAWDQRRRRVTGARFIAKVGYILRFFRGLKKGWVAFTVVRPTFKQMRIADDRAEAPSK